MIVGEDILLILMLTLLAFSREVNSKNSENRETGKFQLASEVKSQQYVST